MIWKFLGLVLYALIALWLSSSLLTSLSSATYSYVPDLLLVAVVFFGLYYRSLLGLFAAFAIGLLSDFSSAVYLGPSAGAYIASFLMVVVLSEKIYSDQVFARLIMVFAASLLKSIVYGSIIVAYTDHTVFEQGVLLQILVEAFLTAVLAPFAFRFLGWVLNTGKAGHKVSARNSWSRL